jgi:hypothetical protein
VDSKEGPESATILAVDDEEPIKRSSLSKTKKTRGRKTAPRALQPATPPSNAA